MGLSFYNIKKWVKMFCGKSIMHVNQNIGKYFVPGEIKGYFNNLTEKVTRQPELLKKKELPLTTDEKAGIVVFPIAIFQYGLGCYDMYIETGEKIYLEQFQRTVDWAIENQEPSGAWNNFGFIYPNHPYSSMCQGEGISLLIRAYKECNEKKYLNCANKAADFMLKSVSDGGTATYEDGLIFYEFTNRPCVLNGWIFSIFGLYELSLLDKLYYDKFKMSLDTLKKYLKNYDNGYWSMYDLGGHIASPFYHKLHIAQVEALYMIDNDDKFKEFKMKLIKYQKKGFNRFRAFCKKAIQKVFEKN